MAQPENPDGPDNGLGALDDVELVSFKANPEVIGPFGASTLSWEVKGPPTGFHVELNNANVARKGQKLVQPQSNTTYRLRAVGGGSSVSLGTVTVHVNMAACETNSLFNPHVTIRGMINSQIQQQKDLYFKDETEVIFTPGTIRFKLHLGKRINNFPDATVEIDASLGLRIEQGHVVSFAKGIKVDISVPWYAWLIPGAAFGLALAIAMGEDSARTSTQKLIDGIGQLIDFVAVFPTPNLVKHSVRIGVTEDEQPLLDVTACPNDLLVKLSELSASTIVT
jgi:hypothetical protein